MGICRNRQIWELKSATAFIPLRIDPQTHIPPKRAWKGVSENILHYQKYCPVLKKIAKNWFFRSAVLPVFLKKIGGRAQKNPFFSKLRHFQRNPRYALESPTYALSSEYRVVRAIRSRFFTGSHFLIFLSFFMLIPPMVIFFRGGSNFFKSKHLLDRWADFNDRYGKRKLKYSS